MNWDRAERERLPADDPQEDQFVGEPVAVAAVMSRSVNEENAAWDGERCCGCWEFQFPYFF